MLSQNENQNLQLESIDVVSCVVDHEAIYASLNFAEFVLENKRCKEISPAYRKLHGEFMDPIANLFTTIENAQKVGKPMVVTPASKFKLAILGILKKHRFIEEYKVVSGKKPMIRIAIGPRSGHYHRVSKLSARFYVPKKRLPFSTEYRLVIVSTSAGVMESTEAQKKNLGGELIGEIV